MLMRRSRKPDDRSESGTMAVEFALALPMLVLFVGACIQIGSNFLVKQKMENAAREVIQLMIARDMKTVPGVGIVQAVICGDTSAETAPYTAERTTCNLLGNSMSFVVTALQPDPADPVNRDVSLTITVPMADAALVDILGLFGSGNLQTQVTMRKIEL